MGLYEYKNNPVNYSDYKLSPAEAPGGILTYDLEFHSPFTSGIKRNDAVHARIFQKNNKSSDMPVSSEEIMILVHGFATRDRRLGNYYDFALSMAKKNITSIFIDLPYHLKRTPEGESSGGRVVSFDDVQTLDFFHQAVVDIRRLIDISSNIVKPSKIYICGISMGCMISTIALAFDKRIDKASLLLGGGNWEEVHWKGVLKFILNGDCSKDSTNKKRVECRKAYGYFPAFLKKFKRSEKEGLDASLKGFEDLKKFTPKACFLCDPMAFAHMADPDRILMINSRFDLYFSRKSTIHLWNELGKPEIRWINNLHSSKILRNKRLQNTIYEFYTR
jgi:hypothetical protein